MDDPILGTSQDDVLQGDKQQNTIIGQEGDDHLIGAADGDILIGDFGTENLLQGGESANSFSQYAANGDWSVETLANGHSEMTQSVQTVAGGAYSISFEAAANTGEGHFTGAVEVLWNGEVIDTIDTSSGIFEGVSLDLVGTGGMDALTFRSVESTASPTGPEILTDAPIAYYEKQMEIGGEEVTVRATAPGQPNVYQIMNGTLHSFDVKTQTYTKAGAVATVVINSLGFNQEDDLFYGIAVGDGVDSLGNAVSKSDIMMVDAGGNSYRLGDGPYRAWTGDFDDKGNLWSFHSSMDRVSVIDVDQFDADGNPEVTVYKFPADLVTQSVWDVAFDAASQKFYGVVRPTSEGQSGTLMIVDTSEVANGGEPSFSTMEVTGTMIDGILETGLPAITFGASIVDGDGNLYVGGNGGDHDMDDATGKSGGMYRVEIDEDAGTAHLVLVAAAPKSYSNDGAADPRAMDPFSETDPGAMVLIRSPELVTTPDASKSYNDMIEAGAGADLASGGFGEDMLIGASAGDDLYGDTGDDQLYGGAGPDQNSSIISTYDEEGLRYDQFGNLLEEDDDALYGGEGNDFLSGSAGHDDLHGGAGDDELDGGTGSDSLYGDDGNDLLSGGKQDDELFGGEGQDVLSGGSGNDLLDGGNGVDDLAGGSGDDVLLGGAADDLLNGGSGHDVLDGGTGNDRLKAGSGDDTATGGDGNDYINAGSGDDVVDGGAGKDTIYMGAGSDDAYGGSGSDRFVFRFEDLDSGTDFIWDFVRDGSEKDRLDFRALDLLSTGVNEEDWVAQNVTQQDSGTVQVDLQGTTLGLLDHSDLGDAFYAQVVDAFEFV
ncbi:MAG: type I secretion protein [Pseudomonadota bacterium]